MKKLILLFSVLALTFTSCNSDDDNSSQDPFVGTWKYYKYFEDGVEIPLEDCEDLLTIVISSNGTYITKDYFDYGNGCELDYTDEGIWENEGSGTYSITSDGETFTQSISFEGNTMIIEEVDEGIIYKDVFIRQ